METQRSTNTEHQEYVISDSQEVREVGRLGKQDSENTVYWTPEMQEILI